MRTSPLHSYFNGLSLECRILCFPLRKECIDVLLTLDPDEYTRANRVRSPGIETARTARIASIAENYVVVCIMNVDERVTLLLQFSKHCYLHTVRINEPQRAITSVCI